MKKVLKVFAWLVVALVVLVLVAVLSLPMWIGPAVKTAASVGGPKVLGVNVSIGDVKLSPLSGAMTISKLSVGNPKGYSDRAAFAVDKVDVVLDVGSLFGKTIVVRKVEIDDPAISYESKNGQSNFDAIQANATQASGAEKEKAAKKDTAAGETKKSGKKVIIELFTLKGAEVSYSAGLTLGKAITLPLPPITLHDIGKESGGASPVEVVTKVVNEIMNALTKAVTSVAGSAGDLLKDVGSGASDAAKGVGNSAKDAVKSLKNLFK
jgi:hypothetical protein